MNKSSVSCSVKTDVGSSIINTFGFLIKHLIISTFCFWPADKFRTGISRSILKLYFFNISLTKTLIRVLVNDILKKYNFKIDLDIPVLNLSAGQKQKVEIIRCLIRNPKVLIMDEPTSVLTEQETDDLFISLKQFSKDGILIIYITHKLKEVLSLCDEVAVMRKGKVVSVSNTTVSYTHLTLPTIPTV